MPILGAERGAVQKPLLRYAQEAAGPTSRPTRPCACAAARVGAVL